MQNITAIEAKDTAARIVQSPATLASVGTALSKDGTPIAFDRIGTGPPVILVDGALCCRGMGQSGQVAKLLARYFTVFTYDRRGRGGSGETAPYAVEREIEDIAALLREAGGAAFLWGMSSGVVLALEAANRLSGIRKLALYEAPFIVDNSRSTTERDWARIAEAGAAKRASQAVKSFLKTAVLPGFFIAAMPLVPRWAKRKALAHPLLYARVR